MRVYTYTKAFETNKEPIFLVLEEPLYSFATFKEKVLTEENAVGREDVHVHPYENFDSLAGPDIEVIKEILSKVDNYNLLELQKRYYENRPVGKAQEIYQFEKTDSNEILFIRYRLVTKQGSGNKYSLYYSIPSAVKNWLQELPDRVNFAEFPIEDIMNTIT